MLTHLRLDHEVSSVQYEHSSVPSLLKNLFKLQGPGPDGYLTIRDQTANCPLHHMKFRTTPRRDLYWLHEGSKLTEPLSNNIEHL